MTTERQLKKLGFGFMRLPREKQDDPKSIDVEKTMEMVDSYLKEGFTYCDTAWMYHGCESEGVVGRVVTDRYPRDAFFLATKLPLAMLKSEEHMRQLYATQKENLHTDFFDYYLLHDMCTANYETAKKFGAIDFLREKRDAGEIKHLGFSIHDNAEFLERVLTEQPDMEFVQLQINYLDWESEGVQSRKCYEVATRHGKPVIAMEPVKGGTLTSVSPDIEEKMQAMHPDWSVPSWAIRFAASLDNVMMVLSGMSDMEQLKDNMSFMKDFTPLTKEEMDLLLEAAAAIREQVTVPCTGCQYCMYEVECPKGILIPNYLALLNTENLRERVDWSPEKEFYANYVKQGNGAAADCIGCGECERVCPQHIKISDWMPKVEEALTGEIVC